MSNSNEIINLQMSAKDIKAAEEIIDTSGNKLLALAEQTGMLRYLCKEMADKTRDQLEMTALGGMDQTLKQMYDDIMDVYYSLDDDIKLPETKETLN